MPSVPAEQFSTSVLAEQLTAIVFGVKELHVVYAANDNFYGGASPRSPRGPYATVLHDVFVSWLPQQPILTCMPILECHSSDFGTQRTPQAHHPTPPLHILQIPRHW